MAGRDRGAQVPGQDGVHAHRRRERAGAALLQEGPPGPAWDVVQLLDLDDHIGVRGTLFRTRTGEVTVRAAHVTLLAKSLRPLPRGKTQVGPDGTVSHGGLRTPRSATVSGTPTSPCTPRYGMSSECGQRPSGTSGGVSTGWAFSRLKRRSCNRSMAEPRPGPSSPITMRSTCRYSFGSRTSCTSSACWWGTGAGVRDRPRFSQRGHGPDPQSRVHHAGAVPGLCRLHRHDGPDRIARRRCVRRVPRHPGHRARRHDPRFHRPLPGCGFIEGIRCAMRAGSAHRVGHCDAGGPAGSRRTAEAVEE